MAIELLFQEKRTWSEIRPGEFDDPEPVREVVIPEHGELEVYTSELPAPGKFDYTNPQIGDFCKGILIQTTFKNSGFFYFN